MTCPEGGADDTRPLVEATAWRTRLWESGRDSTPDFEIWLSDEINRRAWDRVQSGWNLFAQHATSPELLDLRRQALGRVRGMGRQRWAARHSFINRSRAAIAAGIFVLAVGGAIAFRLSGPDVYQTGAGERRAVTLADGSQVQLDSLTELRVDYSAQARDLRLIKGQARFDVAQDASRPFSVVAADRKVVALGTAFNVDLLGKNLFVTLLEGKVVVLPRVPGRLDSQAAVSVPQAAAHAGHAAAPRHEIPLLAGIELKPGEQLALSAGGASKVEPASVQRATAWQSGQLVFENEPLSTVLARVNRYSIRPVTLEDEKMASLRISGVFNAGDIDGFITTVTHYLPVTAIEGDEAIYLSARSAPSNR